MLELLEGIGGASVWAFWVPVLVWTGLAGVAGVALKLVRGLHPIAGYRLRQALLLALPVSILAAPWVPGLLPPSPGPAGPVLSVSGAEMAPSVSGGVVLGADPAAGVDLALALLGAATIAFVLLAVARLAILATDLRQLRRLRQLAARVDDPAPRRRLRELAEQLGVRRPVELLEGPPDSAAMTFGAWRPVIMVPRAMLLGSPDSLDAVLAHELIHIRRADYSWALLECLISAAFAFHPLVWLLRQGIERCRETSCDAEVLARGFVRPGPYAELLAHNHTPTQFPMPAVAASLSAPSLKLKERLEAMKNFARKHPTSRQRVGIVLGAGLVCLVIAIAGACATRTEDEPQTSFEPSFDLEALGEYGAALQEAETEARSQIAEHEAEIVRSYQSARLAYQITRGTGSNQYTYRATEEDVLKALALLDLEMEYLREQMDEAADAISELSGAVADFNARGEEYWQDNMPQVEALIRDRGHLKDKLELFKTMRAERMRESETVKLQYETQKRMRESR